MTLTTPHRFRPARLALGLLAPAIALSACGSDDTPVAAPAAAEGTAAGGLVTVDPATAASVLEGAPADLVVLDIRTPEEFAEGHLEGATLLDFYDPGFADALADLDPDVPYVLYCRSDNRSGQAMELMRDLGFADVTEVDGGILAWAGAGLPIVAG